MAEAVRRVAGVRVQSTAVSTMAESAAGTQSAYRSVVQLDAAGRAVDARVLSESWETTRVPELGQQVYYRATFAITVEHEQGTPDAAFAVDLTLPRTEFVAHSADPRQNDELVAAVRVTQSAQLWLFSVAGDSVHLLIPNEYQAPVEATADARLELPDATWRSRGLRLRVSLPGGSERQDELLTVVALRGPARASARHMTLLEFQRWLVRIPAGQRAVGFAPYSVRLAIH